MHFLEIMRALEQERRPSVGFVRLSEGFLDLGQ